LSILGLVQRWGCPVLFTLARFFFGLFWCPSPYLYTHDAFEGMMEGFGFPVIWAVVGAIAGVAGSVFRSLPASESDQIGLSEKRDPHHEEML
jgi:hypothetical protein